MFSMFSVYRKKERKSEFHPGGRCSQRGEKSDGLGATFESVSDLKGTVILRRIRGLGQGPMCT